jgi:tRNA G10  N-methylase Trm11
MIYKYIFILGNNSKLSIAEIRSILDYHNIKASYTSLSPQILQVNTEDAIPANYLDKLGGTIKVGQIFSHQENNFNLSTVINFLSKQKLDKFTFALSFYNIKITTREILRYLKNIKQYLKQSNKKTKFILPKQDSFLSSAQTFNKILPQGYELICIKNNNLCIYAQVIYVQNIKLNKTLDYDIPRPDAKNGMLPPKLARIMVNLSLSKYSGAKHSIYDPFCGTGRVAMESLLLKHDTYCSDIDPQFITKTQENIQWLNNKLKLKLAENFFTKNIFVQDATSNNHQIKQNSIDAIVTEPYLGPVYKSNPTNSQIQQNFSQLSQLYENFFFASTNILKPKGKIVCVFPKIGSQSLLDKIVDKISALGYYNLEDFEYKRDYQIVKRHIGVFEIIK